MKFKPVVFLLGFLLFLVQSCVPSLHPLYTADVLVLKKELIGTWLDDSSARGAEVPGDLLVDTWKFEANKDQSYSLIYFDSEGKPATFDAHLVRLDKDHFLNISPRMATSEEKERFPPLNRMCFNDLESFHYYPVNTFFKVTFSKEELRIAMLDGDFLKTLLDQNRIRIKHEKIDSDYILTASSKDLQKFILKYADDPKAFPDPMLLKKQHTQ